MECRPLKVGDLLARILLLKKEGMSDSEIRELPIFVGDDEELNGIHEVYFSQIIAKNKKDDAFFFELIEQAHLGEPAPVRALLIS